MKKFLLTAIAIFLFFPVGSYARSISFGEFLDQYTSTRQVPSSTKYIKLNYTNIIKDSYQEKVLQKVIYLDLLPNTSTNFPFTQTISELTAAAIIKKFDGLVYQNVQNKTLTEETMQSMMSFVKNHRSNTVEVSVSNDYEITQNKEFAIMDDVYKKLLYQHYNKANFNKQQLIQGAIKGMTEATDDEFTAYFPPIDSKNFLDTVNGSFVGIGAYVDMPQPGKLVITAPLEGSPAAQAGIQAGDIIIAVDDTYVTEQNSKEEIVNWIKGEPGTKVSLTIMRDGRSFLIPIIRDTIVIKAVTSKVLDDKTLLIDINMFSENSYEEFVKALTDNKVINKNKIIIDLTDNPGGALEEVVKVLDHFVPAGQPTVVTKDLISEDVYTANEVPDSVYLGDKQIIILINKGSASASEIMAGTVREYVNKSILIGEKSFGKGSVQGLIEYFDNSLLKITIANWLTGKNRRLIDHIGITPDITIEDNIDTELNEILERAKTYSF